MSQQENNEQIMGLSNQLITAVEQLRAAERNFQLCKNQQMKAEIVIKEVNETKAEHKMYRSLGRMFIIADKEELGKELDRDLKAITDDMNRAAEMKKTFETKKETLTKQLDDLTPKQK